MVNGGVGSCLVGGAEMGRSLFSEKNEGGKGKSDLKRSREGS